MWGRDVGAGGQQRKLRGERLCLRRLLSRQTVWAKTLGRGRQGDDDDNDGRRGGRVFVGVGATPIPAVKHPPLPDGEGEGEWRAGWTQQSTYYRQKIN